MHTLDDCQKAVDLNQDIKNLERGLKALGNIEGDPINIYGPRQCGPIGYSYHQVICKLSKSAITFAIEAELEYKKHQLERLLRCQ